MFRNRSAFPNWLHVEFESVRKSGTFGKAERSEKRNENGNVSILAIYIYINVSGQILKPIFCIYKLTNLDKYIKMTEMAD